MFWCAHVTELLVGLMKLCLMVWDVNTHHHLSAVRGNVSVDMMCVSEMFLQIVSEGQLWNFGGLSQNQKSNQKMSSVLSDPEHIVR